MVTVAVGDGALLEVRDTVFRDEADKIAPLLFNPKFSPEQNRAEGRWIQQHTSFDVGFIWDRRYLSLLHVACMAAAEKCIKLLLDPPYSWNPNILDGDGNCPIHYLTKANVPSVFYLMWERSEKSYRPPAYRDRPFCWLIWPQNMGIFGVYQGWYVSRVVYPWQVGQEEHLECRIPMGLFLELSVPHRDDSHDFWTGGWTDCGPRWFWPIPRPKSQTIPYHDEQCKEYPQCLDQLLIVTASDKYMISSLEPVYRLVLRAWMFHTLTEELNEGGITYRVPRPPTLKRLCRFVIRRDLARHCGPKSDDKQTIQNSNQNFPDYSQLVKSLPLCDDLKSYLLYKELWPTTVNILKPKVELIESQAGGEEDHTVNGEELLG